jgi:2-hydroxychromene-2-carboxylate isomerase
MKRITFWLDFLSPYAHLAFEALPKALEGLSWQVEYRPVLLAGLLQHHGQRGPAEIEGKRAWTYRQVLWQSHAHDIPLEMPATHPFNPLGLLRLALACGQEGLINRQVAEACFHHVWHGGLDAADPQRLQALATRLQPARDPSSDAVKGELRANTEAAIAAGLFGVPAFTVDGQMFWGFDALPMLRAWVEGDPWFQSGDWEAAARLPVGVRRQG